MALNYTLVPGKANLQMAVTDTNNPSAGGDNGVKSPEWMIKMDDILSGNVEEFNDFCELFGYSAEYSRKTTGDISNPLLTSASLRHSELVVLIPNGGYSAVLETNMYTGTHVESMTIVRLGNVKNQKVKLQEIVYTLCRIQRIVPELDRIFVSFVVTTRQSTVFVYDYTGQSTGQMVSAVDYSKNLVTV